MAEIPVTIQGIIAPLGKSAEDQPFPAVISGKIWLTGLSVGGGPIIGGSPGEPAHPIAPPPLGIWGPPGPWPTPPIYIPPSPGNPDPPRPAHPIVLPPVDVPPPDGGPSLGWEVQVYWTPENGWAVALVPKEGTLVPTPSKK
jgi:hypothetical protein